MEVKYPRLHQQMHLTDIKLYKLMHLHQYKNFLQGILSHGGSGGGEGCPDTKENNVRTIYGMERLFAAHVRRIYIMERRIECLSEK